MRNPQGWVVVGERRWYGFAGQASLALAVGTLVVPAAHGRGELAAGSAERRQELRRQTLEHRRSWIAAPVAAPPRVESFAPAGSTALVPDLGSTLDTARGARLSDAERDLLRRQLRQLPRFEPPQRD